ncbi:MAG: type 2 lanthipeptide synthetase LanM, partial [Psychrosphaera sp.]|nr:type 2 lanthipeptide synthetase LanM [Psychrosphaera sp.]
LFHLRDDSVIADKARLVNRTVLKTHFIPQYESATPTQEPAAMFVVNNAEQQINRHSLPNFNGQSVPVNGYEDEFVKGFEFGYQLLMNAKPLLAAQLELFKGMNARYVVRPTRVYSRLWHSSCQPYCQQSGLKMAFFYDKLWLDTKRRPYLKAIISGEKKSLLQGDVPLFTNLIGEKSLRLDGALICEDYFKQDGFAMVSEKLDNLSEWDCAAQVKIIRRSFLLGQDHKPSLIKGKLPVDKGWNACAKAIGKIIFNQASVSEQGVFWPLSQPDHSGIFCLDGTDFKLHDGALGIILYQAYLNHVNPGCVDDAVLQQSCRQILHDLTTEYFDKDICGAFEGIGGVVYVISHLQVLWQLDWLLDFGEFFLAKLARLVETDQAFDILAGSSGALLSVLSYYQMSKCSRVLGLAEDIGEHLLAHFVEKDETDARGKQCGWPNANRHGMILTGFSHGTAGIAYALLRLHQVCPNPDYKTIALKAIAYESGTYRDDINNWPDLRFETPDEQEKAMSAWCNGAMGIGLSRVMLPEFSAEFGQDIERAKVNTLANPQVKDHCLCHGHFGNHIQ